MATSIARLKTALDALYAEDVANQKLMKLADAVIGADMTAPTD